MATSRSGKTTISVNLAVLWSNSGYKVAIIDADNQKSLSNWYEARKKYYGDNDTGLSLVPYNSSNVKSSNGLINFSMTS